MKTITQHIRDHALEQKGILPDNCAQKSGKIPSLEELKQTEWSELFERYMRNRLIMGSIRYGRMAEPTSYNHMDSVAQRLTLYTETGNGEHLVDIANLCMVEFVQQNHKNFHFKSGDDGYHSPKKENK